MFIITWSVLIKNFDAQLLEKKPFSCRSSAQVQVMVSNFQNMNFPLIFEESNAKRIRHCFTWNTFCEFLILPTKVSKIAWRGMEVEKTKKIDKAKILAQATQKQTSKYSNGLAPR
ncbi:hypothetical protein Pfo_030913 [Paulownia fortunei]|nr:hypothetical protein Pfo_030913 [Paulownia fortunei]